MHAFELNLINTLKALNSQVKTILKHWQINDNQTLIKKFERFLSSRYYRTKPNK